MEINYLKQALASVVQSSTKADVYLRYLEKCDFNTTLEPHSIIKFSEGDVRSMVGIGQNPNGVEEERQFLNKKQHKCSVKYFYNNFFVTNYLHNKPRPSVNHYRQRLTSAAEVDPQHIKELCDGPEVGQFQVRSQSRNTWYRGCHATL